MHGRVLRTAMPALLLSSLAALLVTANAFAHAEAHVGKNHWVCVATSAVGGAPCSQCDCCSATCTSVGVGGNSVNWAYAHASAGRYLGFAVTARGGRSTAGRGLSAQRTQAGGVPDSFNLNVVPVDGTHLRYDLNGKATVRRLTSITAGETQVWLTVYPDSAAAARGDSVRAVGKLTIPLDHPVQYEGIFSSSDFVVAYYPSQVNPDSVVVQTNGTRQFTVAVPDTGVASGDLLSDASLEGPGLTPVGLTILALLLTGTGVFVLRRRRGASAA